MEISGDEKGDVEDRRGLSGGKVGGGIVGIIVMMAAVYIFGLNPQQAQQLGNLADKATSKAQPQETRQRELTPAELKVKDFYVSVLGTINAVWKDEFKKEGYPAYTEPKMVLFDGQVDTGCGPATADVGPFYCPADRKLYLDTAFFKVLEDQLGGSASEFSQAYVVAHECGHHVQNLLGYSRRVDEARGGPRANDASVRLELQADYLAGCWANHSKEHGVKLDVSDLDSALKTAHSIGDDKLQRRSGREVEPKAYTHGTSDQRKRSFTDGYKTGDASKRKLDTFFEARQSGDL